MRSIRVSAAADYAATRAAGWQQLPVEQVPLVPAPMVMQPNGFIQAQYQDREYGQTPFIEAQSVHDGISLAVRLRWPAEKPFNGGREGFPDGAAIAFPVKGEPALVSEPPKGVLDQILAAVARVQTSVDGLSKRVDSLAERVDNIAVQEEGTDARALGMVVMTALES